MAKRINTARQGRRARKRAMDTGIRKKTREIKSTVDTARQRGLTHKIAQPEERPSLTDEIFGD